MSFRYRTSLVVVLVVALYSLVAPFASCDWVTDCRAEGFDPDRLACSTCETILKGDDKRTCQECCQSWLDTPRITRPFASAILVERAFTGDELTTFLKDDFKDVVQQLSAPVHHVKAPSNAASSYFSMGRIPSQLLFFDSTTAVDPKQDVVKLQEAAQDAFDLHGLKREDLKDMLLTLLPVKKKS